MPQSACTRCMAKGKICERQGWVYVYDARGQLVIDQSTGQPAVQWVERQCKSLVSQAISCSIPSRRSTPPIEKIKTEERASRSSARVQDLRAAGPTLFNQGAAKHDLSIRARAAAPATVGEFVRHGRGPRRRWLIVHGLVSCTYYNLPKNLPVDRTSSSVGPGQYCGHGQLCFAAGNHDWQAPCRRLCSQTHVTHGTWLTVTPRSYGPQRRSSMLVCVVRAHPNAETLQLIRSRSILMIPSGAGVGGPGSCRVDLQREGSTTCFCWRGAASRRESYWHPRVSTFGAESVTSSADRNIAQRTGRQMAGRTPPVANTPHDTSPHPNFSSQQSYFWDALMCLIMPSTARGNPGEVLDPSLPSNTPTPPITLPPFCPRPCRVAVPKSHSKTRARLQFVTLPRRRPPYTLRAACARFRLAKKRSTSQQFDNATPVPVSTVELLEARARHLDAQLQQLDSVLDAVQKLHRRIIYTHPLASSSSPHISTHNSTQHLVRMSQCELATCAAVAPLETRLRALSAPATSSWECDYVTVTSHDTTVFTRFAGC
ncbi:hypothetical protein GGX14DRAFT_392400 [Mycena pura]|uniref:Uncharacterized protein n=1 Tax=Mycena pura TaxID=153505 RepID=A0AAD6VIV4_9AGAR|nr:hypothetical protein GGX14DRAFT_392400 [Mycena pura]